jgi:hypothetical protein
MRRPPLPALAVLLLLAAPLLLASGCDPETRTSPDTGPAPADAGLTPAPLGIGLARVPGDIEPLFLGVWAAGPTDVWFAGGTRGPSGGLLARFDGQRITREPTPIGPTLWWIWGADARHIWACGQGGRILAWRDRAWVDEPTGLPTAPCCGACGARAAPTSGRSAARRCPAASRACVLRSTGDGIWRRLDDPALPVDLNLYKVWGTGPDDVHIVGEGGRALRWDGTALHAVETGTTDLIFTVHGRAAGPILAVGGVQSGLVRRWDGARWVEDGAPDGLPPLNGVFVHPDGEALVTGARGVVARRALDGTWTRLDVARDGGFETDTLHALSIGADIWAVGGDFATAASGTIVTDRRPLPPVDLAPVAPPDAGVGPDPDAALDARIGPDLAFDAGSDAMLDAMQDALVDALPDAMPDARCHCRCHCRCPARCLSPDARSPMP